MAFYRCFQNSGASYIGHYQGSDKW